MNFDERCRANRIFRRVAQADGASNCLDRFSARSGAETARGKVFPGRSDSAFRMSFVFMVVDDFALMVD